MFVCIFMEVVRVHVGICMVVRAVCAICAICVRAIRVVSLFMVVRAVPFLLLSGPLERFWRRYGQFSDPSL